MHCSIKSVIKRLPAAFVQRLSAFLLVGLMLFCVVNTSAQTGAAIPCAPGGPPPGSVPRAIAKAPQFTIPPSLIPVPGTYLWVLYENRYLSLLLLPENWPASPAIQVNTMNLSVPSGFGIPSNFELYDVATGPGNFSGYGFYYTTARVIGRDPATGQHRTQIVGISAGGGCGNFLQPVLSLNINPASAGAVQYPQDYLIYHLWSLEQAVPGLEPGTSTPDQNITLRHLPTGGVAVLPPVDEDQILCAPGVNCPNWGDTLIQQMTGDAVHLLLRNQVTGAQSIGWLNLGNAGFGGFNGCAGSVNPCLYQRANLPAPISGNVIDIAGETFIPNRVWALWTEGVAPASATPNEASGDGPWAAASRASASNTVIYKLGALDGNGALLGSMTLGTPGGSGGGNGPDIEVTPPELDFSGATPGQTARRVLTLRNAGRAALAINSLTLQGGAASLFNFCGQRLAAFSLRPGETRELPVCFTPRNTTAVNDAVLIHSNDPDEPLVTVPCFFQEECCKGEKAKKKQVYSRGNNDPDEMDQQKKKTGTTYQFQTAKFELEIGADPAKCQCDRSKEKPECKGSIDLRLEMKILEVTQGRNHRDPDKYALLDGVEASGTTEKATSKPPGPDVETKTDKVDYPALRDENKIRQTRGRDYSAAAVAKVPCKAGVYVRRFHLVPPDKAGAKGQTPGAGGGLAVYVDVIVTVKETGACELKVELKAFLLEFKPGFDFSDGGKLPGANEELPEVDHQIGGGAKGKTRNILKLVEEHGKKIDEPFVKK